MGARSEVTGLSTTQDGNGSTVIVGGAGGATSSPTALATSASSSSGSSSSSRGSATGRPTQNGGTVLDQAGSGSTRIRVGSLWALGCVLGVAWLWW